ncbi:MAG: hypothetical protein U9N55_01365, partial [candidate division Zixibacteria bacterium]|nr:hypothetical protein [candidate division Zixibacteria bacterium]
ICHTSGFVILADLSYQRKLVSSHASAHFQIQLIWMDKKCLLDRQRLIDRQCLLDSCFRRNDNKRGMTIKEE